mgnify:CR=1 FL=1
MALAAKNGTVCFGDGGMEYIRFGTGEKTMVLLPGLGDGLRTMKGTALPMGVMYRKWAEDYTVYSFSRIDPMPTGCTIRDMAHDLAQAMEVLSIRRADVFGVSMGGMIAQWLAIDYPERVDRLILAVTCPEPNPILLESLAEWVALAKAGDHGAFLKSNLRRIYSEGYCRKNLWMVPILGLLTKPKSYERFFIQAQACREHDALARLPGIRARTLVIGGEQDKALGGAASRTIAAAIPGAELKMYQQWGHGLYEEAPDFFTIVTDFLLTEAV